MDLLQRIHDSHTQRVYVEACLLATDNLSEISAVLELPEQILAEYKDKFFPISRAIKLDKFEYIAGISDISEKQLKLWAITQGFDFLKWRLGLQVSITPLEGVQSLYIDCVYKAKEAFYSQNSTDSSREALKWVNEAVSVAKLIKSWVADSKEAMKDIELALEKLDGDNVTFEPLDSFDDPAVMPDVQDFSEKQVSLDELEEQNSLGVVDIAQQIYETPSREVPGVDYDLL